MAIVSKRISIPLIVLIASMLISIFATTNMVFSATVNCVPEDYDSYAAYESCMEYREYRAKQEVVDTNEATATTAASGGCSPGSGSLASLVFVPWYKYLPGESIEGKCSPVFPKTSKENYDIGKGVPLILIAIIELLVRLSGLIAVGYGIYGAIQYTMSQGQPESLKGAKSTITNALVGLIIVVMATGFIQFLGNAFQ